MCVCGGVKRPRHHMHHCGSSLNIKTHSSRNTVQNNYENNMFPFHTPYKAAWTHVVVFCYLNSRLIFNMKCALGRRHHPLPPPLVILPRRKMARSVAACSIFKRRCNLPTIPDAAECRGWVLDRHIYLTESGEGGSQEGWSEKDEAHAKRQKLWRGRREALIIRQML